MSLWVEIWEIVLGRGNSQRKGPEVGRPHGWSSEVRGKVISVVAVFVLRNHHYYLFTS